jgi:integrase/recombinase XerD
MKKDHSSLFTPYIEDMLIFKVGLGFERRTYEGFLNDFSRFCKDNDPLEDKLTMDLALAWGTRRPTENQAGFRRRISALRELGKYLNAVGIEGYVIPSGFAGGRTSFTPYIFSDEELIAMFAESDRLKKNHNASFRHLIVPVLLRMIYFCGLRPNEGREVRKSDVDLDEGILFIRKNKTHKERYVPMSEDMHSLCITYNEKLQLFSPESEYFFPNREGVPYSAKWLTQQFLGIWQCVKPKQCSARVRVYDLRHRFATAVMMQWLDEGADLYAKMPYFSAYMGHVHFSDTAYYIHLLPSNLTRSASIDWDSFSALIPEVEPW